MCRRVTGLSIGLVLGAGGARGLAHLGVIRALEEAGVRVDLVGGTSQGAFIGALFAKYPDQPHVLMAKARTMANHMSSMTKKVLDLTLPFNSLFSGKRFNQGLQRVLGLTRIQDTPLSFFCVTTDICKSKQVVHTKGLLWKYVRASMSLHGLVPPISEGGSMLLDGAYMNVLPADVMLQMGARTIIAVDVSIEPQREYYAYGTTLSGCWILWNKVNPFAKTGKVPSMFDLGCELLGVNSKQHKDHMKETIIDLYLKPPVQTYGTLDFDRFDEIVAKGYEYATPIVEEWVRHHPWHIND
jgi:lysophospholipid hydrolase